MIEAKQTFLCTSNLKGYGFNGNKTTVLFLTPECYSLSLLSAKLYSFLNLSSGSKAIVILMYDDANVEFNKHLYQGAPAISKTVALMNMKFCRVLKTSLNVLEMLNLFT